jgi:hypothetical protein
MHHFLFNHKMDKEKQNTHKIHDIGTFGDKLLIRNEHYKKS